jgi:hypothetical protein
MFWCGDSIEIPFVELRLEIHRFVKDAGYFQISIPDTVDEIMLSSAENAAADREILPGFAAGVERIRHELISRRFQQAHAGPDLSLSPRVISVAENGKKVFVRMFGKPASTHGSGFFGDNHGLFGNLGEASI